MRDRHVLYCHPGQPGGEAAVREAAALCSALGARLSVVLPVVDAKAPRGCCGIQGDEWKRIVDADSRESLTAAAALLSRLGHRPTDLELVVGASRASAVAETAERLGCDVVAVAGKRRPWSLTGWSKRDINAVRRSLDARLVVLRDGQTASLSD